MGRIRGTTYMRYHRSCDDPGAEGSHFSAFVSVLQKPCTFADLEPKHVTPAPIAERLGLVLVGAEVDFIADDAWVTGKIDLWEPWIIRNGSVASIDRRRTRL